MRFFAAASLTLAALSSSTVSARVPHSLLARESSDTCGNVNAELIVPNSLGILTAVGVIDACLCFSGIPSFLETNVVAILAVTIAGESAATQALMSLISSQGETCTYPDNAVPQCQSSNACGFTCGSGFVATPPEKPETCSCPSPNIVCDGQCVSV